MATVAVSAGAAARSPVEVKRIGPDGQDLDIKSKKGLTKWERLRKFRAPKKVTRVREELQMNKIVPSESRALIMEGTAQEFFGSSGLQGSQQKTQRDLLQKTVDPM